jgi:hypothetical protein
MTIIERWSLHQRIEDLGHVRRFLFEQADRQAFDRQVDRNAGYDSSLAQVIKRLDRTIAYLCVLDTEVQASERVQASRCAENGRVPGLSIPVRGGNRMQGKGSPHAAELDRRLAGDEPLTRVVEWWLTAYREWSGPQPYTGEGGPGIADLTENEDAVYCLGGVWWFSSTREDLTKDNSDPDVQVAWGRVRQARAVLQAKQ